MITKQGKNLKVEQSLAILLNAVQVIKDLPQSKLKANKILVKEIQDVISGKSLQALLGAMSRDYLAERQEAYNAKQESNLGPESLEFLQSYGRFKTAVHGVYDKAYEKKAQVTSPLSLTGATAFNSKKEGDKLADLSKDIRKLKEAREFKAVYNSIFSDHALQIGTYQDPTRISSYIDYSPYIYNYQYYLGIPTLSQTIDRPIQIATREVPRIECKDEKFGEAIAHVLKRTRFVEKLRKMLLYSNLSPRGSLIAPIQEDNRIRFNIFNDTQFTYSTGYQYTRFDYKDDGADGVTQIFALGHLLRNGVTAHFLCPGFEPIFAIGKNRLFQLKGAAEGVNIFLYTVKVLCIRAQVLIQKWGGEGQNDSLLQQMRNVTADINSKLSLSTAQKIPEGSEFDILNNNITEGFSKVAPIIKDFQGMLSGITSEFFYGSENASYGANNFNMQASYQTLRSEVQEGQIEPIYRFVINSYLRYDERFVQWKKLEDDFEIIFEPMYEPGEKEKMENDKLRIENIIAMAAYPELQKIFIDEDLLSKDHVLPKVKLQDNITEDEPP